MEKYTIFDLYAHEMPQSLLVFAVSFTPGPLILERSVE